MISVGNVKRKVGRVMVRKKGTRKSVRKSVLAVRREGRTRARNRWMSFPPSKFGLQIVTTTSHLGSKTFFTSSASSFDPVTNPTIMFKALLSRSLRSTTALLRLPSSSSHLHRPFASSLPKLVQPPPPSYSPDNDFKASTSNTVHVAGVSSAGVELTDGVILPGACILLAGNPFLWNVQLPGEGDEKTWSQFTEDSFRVFEIVGPRPGELRQRSRDGEEEEGGRGVSSS